ncbi:MAG: hypothetical protein ACI815_002264 [Psychroserpens sp.]|jgi:hypothetical protein
MERFLIPIITLDHEYKKQLFRVLSQIPSDTVFYGSYPLFWPIPIHTIILFSINSTDTLSVLQYAGKEEMA